MMAGVSLALTLLPAVRAEGSPDGAEWDVADRNDGCLSCHFSNDDAGPAETGLTIEGLPPTIAAGQSYILTVMLEDPELEKAGFLLSIRSDNGANGSLSAADNKAQTQDAMARSTWDGSRAVESGQARWQLIWTAPQAIDGTFRFDLWGNVGNDDLSPLGDSIRHRVWQLPPAPRN